jgi:hypothetical protein
VRRQSQLANGSADSRLVRVRTAKPKAPANGRKADEAGVDALTGVYDHAAFVALANEMFLSSQQRDAPLALAYFDFAIDDAGRSAGRLILTIGMVHATPGGTLAQLMHDAELRIKEIRRRDISTTRHDNHGPVRVPAKHSKQRAKSGRS